MSIPNKFLKFIAVFFAASSMGSIANAATVTAENSVTFEFDVSSLGAAALSNFFWCGDDLIAYCGNAEDDTELEQLAPNATMSLYFGSTAGDNDLGIFSKQSAFANGADNFSSQILPNIGIASSLSVLFVTLVYVDDEYGATRLTLDYIDGDSSGTIEGVIVASEVPLPAAMPLFAAGLALFGLARRRRKVAAPN